MSTRKIIATVENIRLLNEKEGRVLLKDVVIGNNSLAFNIWVKYSRRFYNAGAKKGSVIEFDARLENIDNYLEINHIRNIKAK